MSDTAWKHPDLAEWSIVGMNHYHINGERRLFVAMVKGDCCIKQEGPDDDALWAALAQQAALHQKPAMSDDAAWLRARPEIVDEFVDDTAWSRETAVGTLAAILPLLRAAIRDDVVRELAGDAPVEIGGAPWDLLRPDVQYDIDQLRAAAHVQGYERAREDAKKTARKWAKDGPAVEELEMAAKGIAKEIGKLKP